MQQCMQDGTHGAHVCRIPTRMMNEFADRRCGGSFHVAQRHGGVLGPAALRARLGLGQLACAESEKVIPTVRTAM